MKYWISIILSYGLSACGTTEPRAPIPIAWPGGCFEFPIGTNPDGEAPMACTLTNGQVSDQQDDGKTDDEHNETKID